MQYRIHDARLGRFLSRDPLAPDYPWNSPYAFSENRVVDRIELEGLESAEAPPPGEDQDSKLQYPEYDDDNYHGFAVILYETVMFLEPEYGFEELDEDATFDDKLDNLVKGVNVMITAYALGNFHGKIPRFKKKSKPKIKATIPAQSVPKKPVATVDPTKNRVKLRKGVKEQIKADAPKTKSGDYIDPNTGQTIPKEGPFDYGHKPGHEWRTRKQMHRERGSTRKEVIEMENDPSLYQIEDPSSNRSHKYEKFVPPTQTSYN